MRPVVWILFGFIGLAIPSMFSDIVKGMIGSKDKKISNVIKQLPQDYIKQIQSSENDAGQFVCQILINHNIPGAIEDLGEDVWKEIKDDWSAVTEFVESLPTLAPQILQGIVQDAEDVVSVVEEIITNPAAALTLIEGGVKTVISDIESVGGEVITFIECLFGCKSSHVTSANPAATLSNSCHSVLAKVPASTTHYYTSTSTYHPTSTAIVYVTGTRPSTPTSTAQSTRFSSSSRTPTASAESSSIHISTSSRTSINVVQPSSNTLLSTSTRNAALSTSGNNQVATTGSSQNAGTSEATGLKYIWMHGVQVWASLLIYFLVFVAAL